MLSFALLGPVQIALDQQPLDELVYSRAQALLAYLAVEQGRQFRRPELASLFWPEASHEIGLGNLRYALHRLRKALGDNQRLAEPYLLCSSRIGFNPASRHRVDVLEFSTGLPQAETILRQDASPDALARLARIADSYRGQFLEDMTIDTATDFGYWVQSQRSALASRACALLSILNRAHENRADLTQAIGFARRQAQIDPCDEEVQRRIMLLLAHSGQRQAALAHYDSLRSHLAQELATCPAKETVQLAEHMRSMCRPVATRPPSIDEPIERRWITVLYCRISSVAACEPPSATLDRVHERLLAVRQRCQHILVEHGGHLIPLPGGCLLAYFGFPVAHQGAAVHAVRAALALESLWPKEFRVQSGVHSGLAVSGRNTPDLDGVNTGLAAGLWALGAGVAISGSTYQLVAESFRLTPLGWLSSQPEAIRAYRVMGSSGTMHRLDAVITGDTVGRVAELAQIQRCWTRVNAGQGGILLLRGEAGIGKSHLVRAFSESLDDKHVILRTVSSPADFLATPGQANPQARLKTLRTQLQDLDAEDLLEVFGSWLDPIEGKQAMGLAINAQQRVRIQRVLLDLIVKPAQRRPMLWVMEDAHCAPSPTLELMALFAGLASRAPILLLLTARPEFAPDWPGLECIELGPLADEQIVSLTNRLGAMEDSARRIAAQVHGNPLFAQEMARMLPAQISGEASKGVPTVPPTLNELFATQLYSLGESRHTAQLAAVIGTEFDCSLLADVSSLDEPYLRVTLASLVKARLLSSPEGAIYRFRHALMRATAYNSLLPADRRAAHRRVARAGMTVTSAPC